MVFFGKKLGQVEQAARQLGHCTGLVTNRFEIHPFREVKRLQEAILPPLVESGNVLSEFRKHSIPVFASDILLRVNDVLEKFGGKIHEL